MHEASLTRALVDRVLAIAKEQDAERVVALRVRLGALSHMSPSHFREHFDVAAAGTIAAGARVEAVEEDDLRSPTAADVVLESVEVR